MSRYGSSEEHQPVLWVRGYPLYAAHLIVAVLVVSMLITAVAMTANVGLLWSALPFDSLQVLHGQVWRLITYGLVNQPSLTFAFDMLMIAWFGREVERIVGRKRFLGFYTAIYLLMPLLLTLIGFWRGTSLSGETGALAVFVAFATFFPDAPVLFTLSAKWVALILVGIYSLMALSSHSWIWLLSLWSTNGLAFAFVRHEQGRWSWPRLRWPRRRPALRVLPDLKPAPNRTRATADVDALLDKIAVSGLSSLTAKERAQLEKRREDLLRDGAKTRNE